MELCKSFLQSMCDIEYYILLARDREDNMYMNKKKKTKEIYTNITIEEMI